MKLKANYHTHTYRCGHALGTDESYVEGAVAIGLKTLGFSDHISFKDYYFPGMRQKRSELSDYVDSILSLKEKYKDIIDIHVGFEAEYIPEFIDDYKDLLLNHKIEYLICGQHCYLENGKQIWYNSFHHSEEMLIKYVNAVIEAMKSGLFSYIAHPDLFMNGYMEWDEIAIRESRRLLAAASKYQIPLEINCAGLRFAEYKQRRNGKGEIIANRYPYPKFWDLASEYDIKGIVGIDAHRKEDFLDRVEIEAMEFAKQHNIKLISHLEFKKIK